MNPVSVCHSVA